MACEDGGWPDAVARHPHVVRYQLAIEKMRYRAGAALLCLEIVESGIQIGKQSVSSKIDEDQI